MVNPGNCKIAKGGENCNSDRLTTVPKIITMTVKVV